MLAAQRAARSALTISLELLRAELAELQRLAPGAVGTYQAVRLDRYARRPTYIHGRVLGRLRRSADAVTTEAGG